METHNLGSLAARPSTLHPTPRTKTFSPPLNGAVPILTQALLSRRPCHHVELSLGPCHLSLHGSFGLAEILAVEEEPF